MKTKNEIGSEFWDAPIIDKPNILFPESTQWFLSGRSALRAVIKELGSVKSVAMPSWCCDSMIKPFIDAGLKVVFYPVYVQSGQLCQEIEFNCDVLFLMDYFGYTAKPTDLSGYKGVVIRDVTHSVFSTAYADADYYFGSLRKWCGVWTGGYAWTRDGHKLLTDSRSDCEYVALRMKAMQQKSEYIAGLRANKDYLKIFDEAEEILENIGLSPAEDRDIQVAKKLDVEIIRNRRRENAEVLRTALSEWLIFPEISSNDAPMFVPVLVPAGNRNALRSYLIRNEIYCPIHWPLSEYHKLNDKEQFIYDNELSLVCDQRYTKEDMYRMVEAIERFWKEA